jgi:N-acetylmuramoyl-L-alanine amidase
MLRKIAYLFLSIFLLLPILSVKETAASTMSDIPAKYKEEIDYLVEKKIIFGYPEGRFYPEQSVTREEAAAMIGRALNLNGNKRKTSFTDVSRASYASGYIQSAFEKGIISGYGDGTYRPNDKITRGEMAFLISFAINLSEESGIYYSDIPTSGIQFQAINKISTAGIAVGYPDGSYGLKKSITRAEFSVVVARSLDPELRVEFQLRPMGERVVTASSLNVRSGPGTSFDSVGLLSNGSKVTIYQVIGDWVHISFESIRGYVHKDYLKVISDVNVIAIDPGHGGSDPGAIANGLEEKEINLDVAQRVQKYLGKAGIKVVMTRTNDTFISLDGRVDSAVQKGADTFVSIHTNSFSGSSANGTETYYSTAALNSRAEASKQLATFIQERLVAAWGTTNRGVKTNDYRVIATNPLPASLVELGFITNKGDSNKLASNQYREAAAKAISLGIQDYYKWKK